MDVMFEKMQKCHKKEVIEILNYYMIHTTAAYREETVQEITDKGIGSLALKSVEETARGIGIKKLAADISTENNASIEFHRKNGFHKYGRVPNIRKKFGRSFGIAYLIKKLL